ncbi:MAG: DegV family protein [Oscillospiraceae bacterium]
MAIKIITDSTSDITLEEANEKGIGLASLTVVIDGIEYKDGVDLTYKNYYQLADATANPIVTSQPSPDVFTRLFTEAKEAGDVVLGLFVSQYLSGAYQSACIARDSGEYDNLYLIDTGNISVSVRLMVYTAMEHIKSGMAYEELCTTMEGYRDRLDAYAIVGDLKYLKRSGRLSPTTAFVANLFNMKPITTLKGKVEVVGKARGVHAAIEKTVNMITTKTSGVDTSEMSIIGYTGTNNSWYKDMVVYCEEHLKLGAKLQVCPIGASVGNHVGAGTVAIAFFRNK